MLTLKPLSDLRGIRHGFFTRQGGVSTGIYSSLNCGYGSGDDPVKVATNRARVLKEMGLPKHSVVTLYQAHTNKVLYVDKIWDQGNAPEADAMITREPGIGLGILTADCAPVLLADAEAGIIGAAHAGWRGALSGVVENAVQAMTEEGAAAERIVGVIGPCIAQRSYEVGAEFPERFIKQSEMNAEFFLASNRSGHYYFDLRAYVAHRLRTVGVDQVRAVRADTCAEEDRFFSYRRSVKRGEADYGRQMSVIYLEP